MKFNMVFIISNPRSGSTLLTQILDNNNHILSLPEAGFIVYLYNRFHSFSGLDIEIDEYVEALQKTRKIEYWYLDYPKLSLWLKGCHLKSYRELILKTIDYYRRLHKPDALIVIDKNNWYLDHIDLLSEVFIESHFIHIIRDPRDVIVSYLRLNSMDSIDTKYYPTLDSDPVAAAFSWKKNINTIENSLDKIEDAFKITVKYENIVNFPNEIKRLEMFLKLPNNSLKLGFNAESTNRIIPKEFLYWKDNNFGPISNSRIGIYKNTFSATQIATLNKILHDDLVKYQYIQE